ncbi:SDR family oxidoreductase [Acidobacteria bacterium AB60]|nr:SDR family oxidoreductase [Acidobacteria bacterium AB60]
MAEKIAFITGGNRGIGLQTAKDLATLPGFTVVIGARDLKQGQEAVKTLGPGANADAIEFDVVNPDHHKAAFEYFNSRFGRLDVLVNNAGVAAGGFPPVGPDHSAGEVPMDVLRRVFETNFFAQVAVTQALLPLIRKSPAGRIVNLASILASLTYHADPKSPVYHAKSFAYDASKSALNAFTIHLAYELRKTKIKVNSAHPGWVKTAMGGDQAPMELSDGSRTSVDLATLGEDGPTGGFFHLGQPLPW